MSRAGAFTTSTPVAEEEVVESEQEEDVKEQQQEDEEEEELELGLTLGAKKFSSSATATAKAEVVVVGPACRILTARDLPPLGSAARQASPDSSSVSSSPAAATAAAGSKRVKADVAASSSSRSPEAAVGSAHPTSYGLVGWPPIGAFRMNNLFNQSKDNTSETSAKKVDTSETECLKDKEEEGKKGRAAGWVKVNIDGEVIGRKVNLNAHRSYETLALALELMFAKPSISLVSSGGTNTLKLLDSSSEFQLTYEDKDGDWMLVGDVPWGMFVDSVKRLRIMRTLDGNALAPRFQLSKDLNSKQTFLRATQASYATGEASKYYVI